MNKKLITTIAMVALVSSFILADDPQIVTAPEDNTGTSTILAVELPEFDDSVSVSGGGQSTVVADAENVPFVFVLQAENGTTWVDANEENVFDPDWDVRDGFDVDFRIAAVEGSSSTASTIKVDIEVGNLLRNGVTNSSFSDYYDAGIGTFDSVNSTSGFDTVSIGSSDFTFKTKPNRYYATNNGLVNFNLNYDGDESAPAGRYESEVTIAYSVQ